jgi:NADH dehydrogenase, FAD-containing subunit
VRVNGIYKAFQKGWDSAGSGPFGSDNSQAQRPCRAYASLLSYAQNPSIMSSHFVVLGAGFAALTAARTLRAKAPQARITLVAPKAEFVYLPSLIWVPTGVRKSSDLVIDLTPFLHKHRIDFLAAEVTGLQTAAARC